MNTISDSRVTRRHVLKGSAVLGGGFVFGCVPELNANGGNAAVATQAADDFQFISLKLNSENRLVLKLDLVEIGQGVETLLTTAVASQLQLSPQSVLRENPESGLLANWQGYSAKDVGGSGSTRKYLQATQHMAAVFRDIFIAAAAVYFKKPVEQIQLLSDLRCQLAGSDKIVQFSELCAIAEHVPVPKGAKVKEQLGSQPDMNSRVDARAKVLGETTYGIDVQLDDMLVAVIQRSPVFGGEYEVTNTSLIEKMPGVFAVVPMYHGVAVLADTYWHANNARNALEINWRGGLAERSDSVDKFYQQAQSDAGETIIHQTSEQGAESRSAEFVTALYKQQYLCQSPLETQNCTAHVTAAHCEVWLSTQVPKRVHGFAARAAGLNDNQVTVHCYPCGGGFGRRLDADYAVEAVYLSRTSGRPVKVVWSREDEIQGGYYRPKVWVDIKLAADESGSLTLLQQKLIGAGDLGAKFPDQADPDDSLIARAKQLKRFVSQMLADPGPGSLLQAVNAPYPVGEHRVNYSLADYGVPVGFCRSVGATHNVFAIESAIDELAVRLNRDPLEYRLALLEDGRLKNLLNDVKASGVWRNDRHYGLAVFQAYGSCVVAIVGVKKSSGDETLKLDFISIHADCGVVANPDIVRQQLEGGALFGLSAALNEEINIASNGVREANFDHYKILRINQVPTVSTYLKESQDSPGGVGELAVPVIAPALCNAISRTLGNRVRELPVTKTVEFV